MTRILLIDAACGFGDIIRAIREIRGQNPRLKLVRIHRKEEVPPLSETLGIASNCNPGAQIS